MRRRSRWRFGRSWGIMETNTTRREDHIMQPTAASANGASHAVDQLQSQVAAMQQQIVALREEVVHLRANCNDLQRTVLALACPKEWATEQINEDDLLALRRESAGGPTLREFIHNLQAEGAANA